MDRIKDLSKVILRGDYILAELVEKGKKSNIIIPDSIAASKGSYEHMIVIARGYSVTDINVGDIVLDVAGNIEIFPLSDGKKIGRFPRANVLLAVTPDNFDFSLQVTDVTPNPKNLIN